MKRRIIAVSNQKGGVGKTTLSREIGIFLARAGRKVLLIDMDPQANLTRSLTDYTDLGVYEALSGYVFDLKEINDRLYLLAGDIKQAALEKSLIAEIDAYTRLKELLDHESFYPFDYILIDSPPSLGVLTVNALTAATDLLIPMSPALYTLQGTNDLMTTVTKVKKNLNSDLSILGVIINAFDSIPVITREIRSEIEEAFGDAVFSSVLSKSIKIEESIATKTGLVDLKGGRVKDDIDRIGREFLNRAEGGSTGSPTGEILSLRQMEA